MSSQLSNALLILKGLIGLLLYTSLWNIALANDLIIDDRTSGNLSSNLGTQWQMFTDQVMGGVSNGELTLDIYKGRKCLRMRGDVSTDNNGGFVQMSLDLTNGGAFDASSYAGVEIIVSGNNEHYNIHFRTTDLLLPWQSYRYNFEAISDWQAIYIPFKDIKAYRTTTEFHKEKLKRIGLVAIGRSFKADLCVASIKLYTVN